MHQIVALIRKFGMDYKQALVFDRIKEELRIFCANHTVDEVYNEKFLDIVQAVKTRTEEKIKRFESPLLMPCFRRSMQLPRLTVVLCIVLSVSHAQAMHFSRLKYWRCFAFQLHFALAKGHDCELIVSWFDQWNCYSNTSPQIGTLNDSQSFQSFSNNSIIFHMHNWTRTPAAFQYLFVYWINGPFRRFSLFQSLIGSTKKCLTE